jgi:hypothetical protein
MVRRLPAKSLADRITTVFHTQQKASGALWRCRGRRTGQGRIGADVTGRDCCFRGTLGTSTIGLVGGAAAWDWHQRKTLKKIGDTDGEETQPTAPEKGSAHQ